ncbi:MAG TPA: rhomboid family intramembrane serine protease, partial [Polyangiaceae bacterium]|nr:rhomboid family intramembrane serine protease [Polyangiaceae bacterium]
MSSTVTTLVIGSVVLVTVVAWMSKPLRSALVLSPFRIRQRSEVHRLLTAGWVHADVTHLLFNMLTLYVFADRVTTTLGMGAFIALYVSAVVVAFVPSTLIHLRDPKYSSLGASGAVSAVLFSAILLHPTIRVGIPLVPVAVSGMVYALGYLVYSAVHAYLSNDGVNHEAHFAGVVYGALFTYVLAPNHVVGALKHL